MKKLSRNEKILIGFLLVMSTLFLYYRQFLSPVMNSISSSKDKISNYEADIDKVQKLDTENKKQVQQIEKLKAQYDESIKLLPKSDRIPEILSNLKKYSDSNSITFINETFAESKLYKDDKSKTNSRASEETKRIYSNVMVVPVRINVSGTYTNLVKFIATLEKSNRMTAVELVNFTKVEGTSDNLSASINLNYYYENNGEAIQEKYDINKDNYGKDNLFQ